MSYRQRTLQERDARDAVSLTDNTGGSHNNTLADGVTVTALTDNTTGSAGSTLAAGVGVTTVCLPIILSKVSAADVLTDYTPGYKFKVLGVSFAVTSPVTTGGKGATLNLEIGSTNVTGGAIALTSANSGTLGAVIAGSSVTAANTGTATDTLSVEASSVTAFTEGEGVLLIKLQNMDTADAMASLAAKINTIVTDLTTQNDNDSDLANKVNELIDTLK